MFSKKKIDEFISEWKGKKRLCNDAIFEGFFPELRKIDFSGIDIERTSFKSKEEYIIELVSIDNSRLPLSFILWRDFVNIYIGKSQIQYADDAIVKNMKQRLEFVNQIQLLFNSNVKELVSSRGSDVLYNYTFLDELGNTRSNFKQKVKDNLKESSTKEILYKSWI